MITDHFLKVLPYAEKLVELWDNKSFYSERLADLENTLSKGESENHLLEAGVTTSTLSSYWTARGAIEIANNNISQACENFKNGILAHYLSMQTCFNSIHTKNIGYFDAVVFGCFYEDALINTGASILFPELISRANALHFSNAFICNPYLKNEETNDWNVLLHLNHYLKNDNDAEAPLLTPTFENLYLKEFSSKCSKGFRYKRDPYMCIPMYGFFPAHYLALSMITGHDPLPTSLNLNNSELKTHSALKTMQSKIHRSNDYFSP